MSEDEERKQGGKMLSRGSEHVTQEVNNEQPLPAECPLPSARARSACMYMLVYTLPEPPHPTPPYPPPLPTPTRPRDPHPSLAPPTRPHADAIADADGVEAVGHQTGILLQAVKRRSNIVQAIVKRWSNTGQAVGLAVKHRSNRGRCRRG